MATKDVPEVLWRSARANRAQTLWHRHVLYFELINQRGRCSAHCVGHENGRVPDKQLFFTMRAMAHKVMTNHAYRTQAKLAFEFGWYHDSVHEYLRQSRTRLTDSNAEAVVRTALAPRAIRTDVQALICAYLLKEQRLAAIRATHNRAQASKRLKDEQTQYTLPIPNAAL